MSKELEALNYVWYNYYTEELKQDEVEQIEKNLNIVQNGLKRLEAIDNSIPSEALEELERILNKAFDYGVQSTLDNLLLRGYNTKNMLEQKYFGKSLAQDLDGAKLNITNLSTDTIKQALLKAQEQEKVLEIIIKKEVHIRHFSEEIKQLDKKFTYEFYCLEFANYHYFAEEGNKLTQEEFELLKEVLTSD